MRIDDEAISLLEIITQNTSEHGRDAIAAALTVRAETLLNAYLNQGIANTTTQDDKSFFGALTATRDLAQLFKLDLASVKEQHSQQKIVMQNYAELSRL
jgi:hypothetical protein